MDGYTISLTPTQESLIQSKVLTGKYKSSEEVLEVALLLFEEYERGENEWALSVREKVQAAIDISEQEPPIDGEIFSLSQMKTSSQHPINKLSGKIKAFQGIDAVDFQRKIRDEWHETGLSN